MSSLPMSKNRAYTCSHFYLCQYVQYNRPQMHTLYSELKQLLEKCSEISNVMTKYYETHKKDAKAKLSRMGKKDDTYFVAFIRD